MFSGVLSNISKSWILLLCIFSIVGCYNSLATSDSVSGVRSEDTSTPPNSLVIRAGYAGSLANVSSVGLGIASVLMQATGCKVNNNQVTYGFSSATGGISLGYGAGNGGTSQTFTVTPNDSACSLMIISVTLNAATGGYANSGNSTWSTGTGTYIFSTNTIIIPGNNTWTTVRASNNNPAAIPSYIYLAGRFNTTWVSNTTFAPTLEFYYGEQINNVAGVINSGYSSLPLSTGSGSVVQAPTYCIASGYNSPCQTGSISSDALIQFDNNRIINYEYLNLYPTASVGSALTIASYGAAAGQTAQRYKIVGLGSAAGSNQALVNNGVFYGASSTLLGGGLFNASAPAGSNCGVITAVTDTSGCTYSVVDALWNNAPNIAPVTGTISNIGAVYTYGYGSFNSATSPTNTYLSLYYSAFTTNNNANVTLFNGSTTYQCATCGLGPTAIDFFGFALGQNSTFTNGTPCPQGGTVTNVGSSFLFCPVQASTSQPSMRYLMLQHLDRETGVPSYLFFSFAVGY